MKYVGSKNRIAKDIVPIIQRCIDENKIKTYIEPFAGGMNIIDKIKCENRFANDNNPYLIELFKNLDKLDTLPNVIDKDTYDKVRDNYNNKGNAYSDWYTGAIGFLASYNGRFFDGGYAKTLITKTGVTRNYYLEAKNNLLAQRPYLADIHFSCGDYETTGNVSSAVIYCDIPYKGVKQYTTSKNFDYDRFWDWARNMSTNNIVIISELNAPNDFNCIWEQTLLRTIDNTKRVASTEKLFTYSHGKYAEYMNNCLTIFCMC